MRDSEKAGGSPAEKSAKALEVFSRLDQGAVAAGLENLKTADLAPALYWFSALWRSSGEAVFLRSAETIFKKLEREKPATAAEAACMQRLFLEAHRFKEARELAGRYPGAGLIDVPEYVNESPVIMENSGKYYQAAPDGGMASLKSMDISSGTFILVYAGPDGSAAERALEKIGADRELAPAFAAMGSLLTGEYDFKKAGNWNSAHPVKYKIMYSGKDWGALNRSSAPGFSFIRDGRLVCYAGGWSEEASIPELRKCLEAAGLDTREARLETALRILDMRAADKQGDSGQLEIFKTEYLRLLDEGAFGEKALEAYNDKALLDAYRLAGEYVFNYRSGGQLDLLGRVLAELDKRKLVTAAEAGTYFRLLLDSRQFDKAAKLRDRYAALKLEAFPMPVGHRGKTDKSYVYSLRANGTELELEAAGLEGKRILIAAQPGCYPTRRAFGEIEKNKELLDIFKERGLLLAARSDFSGVREWNKSHAVKFRLIDSAGDWPGVDFKNSPAFYFLADGKIVYSFVSWPKDGNMDELRKGLAKLGL